jgi:hypothetical protein
VNDQSAARDRMPELIRPYASAGPNLGAREATDPDTELLRPYLLTDGRVEPADGTLEIEAQVVASELGYASYAQLAFEHRDIVRLCGTTMSVAEVAARLGYHIGVAKVLIADLAARGHLVVRRPNARSALDLNIIERVIRGLEAIR